MADSAVIQSLKLWEYQFIPPIGDLLVDPLGKGATFSNDIDRYMSSPTLSIVIWFPVNLAT